MIKVARHITAQATLELWVAAGGRCQHRSCNRFLLRSAVTQARVNQAQRAHIYSFSADGPRGRGPYKKDTTKLNSASNLLLVCYGCHKLIDDDKAGLKYTPVLLGHWKREHEARILQATAIAEDCRSHVVLYASRIEKDDSPVDYGTAINAMWPRRFPASDIPLNLSPSVEHDPDSPGFWSTQSDHLRASFARHISPLIAQGGNVHFSVFGLASMPLLTLLGTLFTEKPAVDTYQFLRSPKGWAWQKNSPAGFSFRLKRPTVTRGEPALVFSLSGRVGADRINAALGRNAAIWELTVPDPHPDFLRTPEQLEQFKLAARRAMVAISHMHGRAPIHLFPAMPVACAVELGRVRMPNVDPAWIIYNHSKAQNKFIPTLTIP